MRHVVPERTQAKRMSEKCRTVQAVAMVPVQFDGEGRKIGVWIDSIQLSLFWTNVSFTPCLTRLAAAGKLSIAIP